MGDSVVGRAATFSLDLPGDLASVNRQAHFINVS